MGEVPFNFLSHLERETGRIARECCGFGVDFQPIVRVADMRFGDFQVNGILPYGKRHGADPRQLAGQLLVALEGESNFSSFAEVEVSGAGFLNITLRVAALGGWLAAYGGAEDFRRAAIAAMAVAGRRVVLDYSCPNSAKQMHVGHLRSLVIGDCLYRLLSFLGAKVIRDNHIGDWGTQFGILLRQLRLEGVRLSAVPQEETLDLLESLYRRGNAEVDRSPEALAEARRELVALQGGDPERLALWKKINELSYASFQKIYDLADVQFDLVLGESFYRNSVARVYDELLDCSIAQEDDGALAVFHGEHKRFREQPFLVRKSDGTSNYAATDLATVLYRMETLGAEEILYVTDGRQRDHFEQLFLTVKKWFAAKNYPLPTLRHLWFGTVCGDDGKAIKTRSGEPVRLQELFDSAIGRAGEILRGKNPNLPADERTVIARAVGVGALKYGDLSQNRTSDYVFSLEKMLSFDGNTAPYLQYAVARGRAVRRRADGEALRPGTKLEPATTEERVLAHRLLLFPVALAMALEDLHPHLLCSYLYDLACEFSSFYDSSRIFGDEKEVAERRLGLCEITVNFLATGLQLLGIEPLDRM
ncbi:MAG: arginine--tRNA ligase [Puniceicoccales bacterium]|jgi:arginyl-tRNA synthetase|nr:arginine--tRNA ligase [Puniceicoccales bacterium]